jgi:hypothetical protein
MTQTGGSLAMNLKKPFKVVQSIFKEIHACKSLKFKGMAPED